MQQEQVKLLKQYYPNENNPLYEPIKLNSTTRIVEMLPGYQKRILNAKNKQIASRLSNLYRRHTLFRYNHVAYETTLPMRYSKVLCHACYGEIGVRYLYVSKNGESGRSKYYHVTCADLKNVI